MHRLHLLRWFALVLAVFGFQCLDSLSDDCHKTRTCEAAPQLGSDCVWRYPDGSIWKTGPSKNEAGLWLWPDGTLTQTQALPRCSSADAGLLGDGGLEPGADNCVEGQCDPGLHCDSESNRCVKCLGPSDCANTSDPNRGQTPACDPRAHVCVVCLNDGDCGTLHCKTDANPVNNRCVECVDTNHCPAGEVCDSGGSNQCTSTCTGPGQCKPPKGICSAPTAGLCVGCLGNNDCSGATPQCNTSRKECVQCVDNTPCTNATTPVCSPGNRCVTCVDDTTCRDENAPHCDPVANGCVACLDSTQCTARDRSRCNALHECVPCTDNSQCESDAAVCDIGTGRCVSCIDDSTCIPGVSVCDPVSGSCVGCTTNEQCNQTPDLARCNVVTNRCEACTLSQQCVGKFGVRNTCSNDECVQCTENGDCAADPNKSRCDGTGLCAGCRTDNDCGAVNSKHACTGGNNGRCVECLDGQDCTGNANGLACNTATNTCVQCVVDGDCKTAGASRCVANQCQPCVNDTNGAHCGHITSGLTVLGVCDTSASPSAGVCVQCTGNSRAACGNKACNSTTKVCSPFDVGSANTCQDCVSDAHCDPGDRCVRETFPPGVGGTNLGLVCFNLRTDPTCPGGPYAGPASVTTVDGAAVDVCLLRRSTCTAVNQSPSLPCTVDADCGRPGLDDGRCDTSQGLCSLPCASALDCPGGSNSTCSVGVCLL